MTPLEPVPSLRALLDYLIAQFELHGRAELAAEMGVTRNVIEKMYQGAQLLSPKQILHIHEWFGVPVQEIRERSGQHLPQQK